MQKCTDKLQFFGLYKANLHCYDPTSLAREHKKQQKQGVSDDCSGFIEGGAVHGRHAK
jgi:hypothetical protein